MASTSNRLLSLDAFRGFTIMGMILVNNLGGKEIYTFLEHAEWDGFGFADLVFPSFLLISGVSVQYSLSKIKESGGGNADLNKKILLRALKLFIAGLVLTAFPYNSPDTFRIMGILQRIAIVYAATSFCYLYLSTRQIYILMGSILLGYWGLMLLPAPDGFPNLVMYTDNLILGEHVYDRYHHFDPEGLLSTFPSIVNGLFGLLLARILRSDKEQIQKLTTILTWGVALTFIGVAWHFVFPVNKQMWTSSFSVLLAGLGYLFFAFFYWICDILKKEKFSRPFLVFGMNAIAAYMASEMLRKLAGLYHPAPNVGTYKYLLQHFNGALEGTLSGANISLLWALTNVTFYFILLLPLYMKKIFIKIG